MMLCPGLDYVTSAALVMTVEAPRLELALAT